ncbi:TPA: acylneuraminate cytidylyltransferase family protein [Campylobacter jejuni]|uniref:acylneuraminate cytidylyltransferase family protein n=1 Tax=Campylobacter jejuni TaxID=197 RepID=UPI000F800521|nr:acylneuraminate cytidylyltransferase family protein [Campylobacter jejuni]RTJ88851.1 CMP-N-acetlyneuraminic acid synthetase [Campylobacter jejuni]HED7286596.1 acylneuraminate cytidylyltransferase family protein [Campylobacter jejuni]HEG2562085.1 acylneuraminate cytidylyltransferase family protein [Campylobacter jejuni]HEG7986105.1 acylneuraminate cytidylyltransferase family protein [Campylobacter jejuni]HEG8042561.1 acylneuraminate cytidylyltransferase family protein [Campylobacter jejuni]
MDKILAIIPARSGSKRLIDKNIMCLQEKPLIAWSIEAALKSKFIDEVVVSTDSFKYANIAKYYGASIPFIRKNTLALDSTPTFDVIEDIIKFYNFKEIKYKYIILLQPTSPLRNEKHIDEAIKLFFFKKANSIISVCECEHSPLWTNVLPNNDSMDNFMKEDIKNLRSQDLPKYYRLNGAIFIAEISNYLKYKSFFMPNSFAYKMNIEESVDIDTRIDFLMAEILLKNKKGNFDED